MKTAYLVVGPESTGTRCTTQILIDAGCHGQADHGQEFDSRPPSGPSPVVWRRSVPHGAVWPDITGMASTLSANGYAVKAVVTTRDWYSVIESHVRRGLVRERGAAIKKLRKAYPFIFGHLSKAEIPFWVVSYEALVMRPARAAAKLMEMLGLSPPGEVRIVDGNGKYYGEQTNGHLQGPADESAPRKRS